MNLDQREFRDALGCFATGVCVVTAAPQGHRPFGMTVNSFTSVSLDPPLVLWNLQRDSEMFGAWQQTRHFAINILHSGQRALSVQYARKGEHLLDAAHQAPGDSGVPLIPDTLVSLECALETTHPGGDHLIVIGRVLAAHHRDQGQPLLFCNGRYRRIQ